MTHIVWMITWRLKFLVRVEAPTFHHLSCLEKTFGHDMFLSMYLPLLHDDSYLGYSPKENLYYWEETNLLEILQSPCELLEDKQNFGGEDCNILNYPQANWNIKFFFNFLFMNKCKKEERKKS